MIDSILSPVLLLVVLGGIVRIHICSLVTMLVVGLTGCSAQTDRPIADADEFRAWSDLNPIEVAPDALVSQASVIVEGEIAGIVDGHSISELDPSMGGQQLRDYTAIVEVKVHSTLKAPGHGAVERVFVSIPRGVAIVGTDGHPVEGSGEGYTVSSLEEISRALPHGTRTVVASSPVDFSKLDPAKRVNQRKDASYSVLLDGMHPQGFAVEQEDGMRGWEGMQFDELVALLEETLK